MPVLMPYVYKQVSQLTVGELIEFKHGDGIGTALVAGHHVGKFALTVLKVDDASVTVPFVLEYGHHQSSGNVLSYGTGWSIKAKRPEFGLKAGHIKEAAGGVFLGAAGLGMCVRSEGFGSGIYITLDPVDFVSPPSANSVAFHEWEVRLDEAGVPFDDRTLLAKWEYKSPA